MKWNIQIDKIALKFIAKQPMPQRMRIIYMVKEEIITVCVTKAGNRGDIYK